MLPVLARLAPPLAAYLAMVSYAAHEVSAAAAAETAALAFFATVVLLAVAALARPGGAEALLGSVLATAAVWVLPHGPLREETVGALLVALFALAAARRLAAERGRAPAGLPLAVALPLALGAQALLRAVVLLPPQLRDLGWRVPVISIVLPVAAALALVVLAWRLGRTPALVVGGIAALLGPGWNVKTTLALAVLAALSVVAAWVAPPRWRSTAAGSRAVAAVGIGAAALLVGAALLTTPPWLRAEPLAAGRGLVALLRPPVTPLAGDVTLGPAARGWEAALSPAVSTRAVVLDSALANSAPLERGRPVATVVLRDAAGGRRDLALRAGIETGEWAAGRPDVAATLRAGSPRPWLSWIVGDSMARRYRAQWALPTPLAVTHIQVERAEDLPAEVLVSLHHLELRP